MKTMLSGGWGLAIGNLTHGESDKPQEAAALPEPATVPDRWKLKPEDLQTLVIAESESSDDGYGNATEMVKRQIIDPLTDEEHAALTAQVAILQQVINQRIRIPAELEKQLATLAKRATHTADDALILNLVMDAHRRGLPLNNPADHAGSAFEDAARKMGIAPKTVFNRYRQISKANEDDGLPPLANTPKS